MGSSLLLCIKETKSKPLVALASQSINSTHLSWRAVGQTDKLLITAGYFPVFLRQFAGLKISKLIEKVSNGDSLMKAIL